MLPKRSPWFCVFGIILLSHLGCSRQDSFPNRPIVLICPWSAGGGTDRIGRQIAVQLEQELGVPVNVVNATGGAGVTGHRRGALARPDGYTITMITPELNKHHWRSLTNITYKDFQPLVLVNRDEAAIFVHSDSPWKSLKELSDAIRNADKGEITASGTAYGGIWHLSMAGWLKKEGIDPQHVTWVPMGGSDPSLDVLAKGGLDLVCCSVPEAQARLDSKRIRCLGIMAPKGEGKPGIPTFQEQGIDWVHRGWRGLAVPQDVPEERVKILMKAALKVARSQEYQKFLENAGFGYAAEPPKEFLAALKVDNKTYGQMLNSPAFQDIRRPLFGPMFFPAILISLLVVGTLMTIPGGSKIALVVGWVIAFTLVVEITGFVIGGIVLLSLLLFSFRAKWQVALLLPIILIPVLYQLFAVTLRVALPWGWLGW